MEGRGLSPISNHTRHLRDLIALAVHRFLARVRSPMFVPLDFLMPVTTSDQLCSIVYSLSGMYFVGCFYTHFFPKFPLSFSPALIDYESSQYASFPDNITTAYQSESFSTQSASSYEPLAQEAWSKCSTAPNWQWFYLLAVLPFAVRFVQSLRRYRDSNLLTHLINVRTLVVSH